MLSCEFNFDTCVPGLGQVAFLWPGGARPPKPFFKQIDVCFFIVQLLTERGGEQKQLALVLYE